MELVVVLVILAALAAIVIPMFPNILRRAHKATDATQTQEVSKLVQSYLAYYNGYPNDWDLLTDNASGAFPDFLPGAKSAAGAFGGFVTVGSLTQNEVNALNAVGITSVQPLATNFASLIPDGDGVAQPTLLPYKTNGIDANRVTIDTSTKFAVINLGQAQTANPSFLETVVSASVNDTVSPATPKFIVLGVGPRNSMVGKVMQDAPTSVPQNPDLTPAKQYARVGAIFMVSGAEVTRSGRARFIAAVAMEDDELELTTKDVVGSYQVGQ
jgi:Tfp pilus assembly protein PilE